MALDRVGKLDCDQRIGLQAGATELGASAEIARSACAWSGGAAHQSGKRTSGSADRQAPSHPDHVPRAAGKKDRPG